MSFAIRLKDEYATDTNSSYLFFDGAKLGGSNEVSLDRAMLYPTEEQASNSLLKYGRLISHWYNPFYHYEIVEVAEAIKKEETMSSENVWFVLEELRTGRYYTNDGTTDSIALARRFNSLKDASSARKGFGQNRVIRVEAKFDTQVIDRPEDRIEELLKAREFLQKRLEEIELEVGV